MHPATETVIGCLLSAEENIYQHKRRTYIIKKPLTVAWRWLCCNKTMMAAIPLSNIYFFPFLVYCCTAKGKHKSLLHNAQPYVSSSPIKEFRWNLLHYT